VTCACGRIPDPGICPITHDGHPTGGHCACIHTPADRAAIHQAAAEKIRALARSLYFDTGVRVLAALDQPAHDDGPSVGECASHDRNYDVEQGGE